MNVEHVKSSLRTFQILLYMYRMSQRVCSNFRGQFGLLNGRVFGPYLMWLTPWVSSSAQKNLVGISQQIKNFFYDPTFGGQFPFFYIELWAVASHNDPTP